MKRQSMGGIIVRAASLTALDARTWRVTAAVALSDGRAVAFHHQGQAAITR